MGHWQASVPGDRSAAGRPSAGHVPMLSVSFSPSTLSRYDARVPEEEARAQGVSTRSPSVPQPQQLAEPGFEPEPYGRAHQLPTAPGCLSETGEYTGLDRV